MKAKVKTWWCGWNVPDAVPLEHMVEQWPAAMQGWVSGYGLDFRTYTGLVLAKTATAANKLIRSCYGASGNEIKMRWDPIEKPAGWLPGDRFPMPKGKVL